VRSSVCLLHVAGELLRAEAASRVGQSAFTDGNSHLLNTHRYQLTNTSCAVEHSNSSPQQVTLLL
jgi:hypothetical protein